MIEKGRQNDANKYCYYFLESYVLSSPSPYCMLLSNNKVLLYLYIIFKIYNSSDPDPPLVANWEVQCNWVRVIPLTTSKRTCFRHCFSLPCHQNPRRNYFSNKSYWSIKDLILLSIINKIWQSEKETQKGKIKNTKV